MTMIETRVGREPTLETVEVVLTNGHLERAVDIRSGDIIMQQIAQPSASPKTLFASRAGAGTNLG